jgi:HAD superfamily hydrolase (TIGR01509 family)
MSTLPEPGDDTRVPAIPPTADGFLATPIVLPGRFGAVVFDMDGVLLDSEPLWLDSYRQLMERHGDRYTDADRVATLGRTLDDSAVYLAARLGIPAGIVADEVEHDMAAHYRRGAPLHAGVRVLLDAIAGRLPIAIATNTSGSAARGALAAAGLDAPAIVVSGADLGRPKPLPDVYLAACRALEVDPGEAIAFEDSPSGARAAAAAGLVVVGVPENGVDLSGTGAHAVIASLKDVLVEPRAG